MVESAKKRAEYGKQIVSPLATQLSWSHFIELLPLKMVEAKLFYAQLAAGQRLSAKALREQISRKAFERTAIADTQLAPDSPVPPALTEKVNFSYAFTAAY